MVNPVRVRGVDYKSQKEAAEALGVDPATVATMLARGKPDGIGRGSHSGKPVTIRGVTYDNAIIAASKLGVTPKTIYHAKKRGTLDRVGLRRS